MKPWSRSTRARAGFIVVLVLASPWLATPAAADDPLEREEGTPGNPSAQPPLPALTVQAQRDLGRRVTRYVHSLTSTTSIDQPLQVWRAPLCPAVAGLPPADGQAVFDRFTRVARSLGLALGKQGCQPNFAILVTPDPDGVIDEANRRKPRIFGDGQGMRKFRDAPRPVRFWYNAELRCNDGTSALSDMHQTGPLTCRVWPSKFEYSVARNFVSIVVVVDLRRLAGLEWRQVTDYVALAGLTRANLDADYGDAPTILRLFSHPVPDLMGMSEWDRQFLRDLYASSGTSRGQRVDLEARLTRDLRR